MQTDAVPFPVVKRTGASERRPSTGRLSLSSVEAKFLDLLAMESFPAHTPCFHWILHLQFPVSAVYPSGSRVFAAPW
jgi:hypothetical protein